MLVWKMPKISSNLARILTLEVRSSEFLENWSWSAITISEEWSAEEEVVVDEDVEEVEAEEVVEVTIVITVTIEVEIMVADEEGEDTGGIITATMIIVVVEDTVITEEEEEEEEDTITTKMMVGKYHFIRIKKLNEQLAPFIFLEKLSCTDIRSFGFYPDVILYSLASCYKSYCTCFVLSGILKRSCHSS
jgi:hypothetical protein